MNNALYIVSNETAKTLSTKDIEVRIMLLDLAASDGKHTEALDIISGLISVVGSQSKHLRRLQEKQASLEQSMRTESFREQRASMKWTAQNFRELAAVHRYLGNHSKAKEFLQRAIETVNESFRADDELVLELRELLCDTEVNCEDSEEDMQES